MNSDSLWVALAIGVIAAAGMAGKAAALEVVAEEDVYTFVNPDNGSGPLWSYGCTVVGRISEEVFASQMETGEGVPRLCNTRWRLLRRGEGDWRCIAEADGYHQREPCPLAVTSAGTLLLNVNDSTQPPGTLYGPCEPGLLEFNAEGKQLTRLAPAWAGAPYFTDHSYRGYAMDAKRDEVLMMNIDAKTSVEHCCLLSRSGETLATSSITYPIRACYPQVALIDRAVHVMAIGDIVEPVEEWRQYKFEQTQRKWDYVFRILYYTWTPKIGKEPFAEPIELANVDDTAGFISNQDLWIGPDGRVFVMYTEQEVHHAFMRDKFFPGKSLIPSLHLAVIEQGKVVARRVLIEGNDARQPGGARFHETPKGEVYAVVYVNGEDGGNKLLRILPEDPSGELVPIPLAKPMSSFCLATVRAGNAPSNTIDIFGHTAGNTMSYAQVKLAE